MNMKTINPANGKIIKQYQEMTSAEVEGIIDSCQKAFYEWREYTFVCRASLMKKLADVLRKNNDIYATLITTEMGKPITQSRAEIEKCALVCEYYADNAEKFLSNRIIPTDNNKSYVRFDPIGIVFAVMPWNFPFWQVFRFAVPSLMAGNVALLKHASNVSGCALAIEEAFKESGFPLNSFRTLLIDKKQTADVIANQNIKAVTFTGSVDAGREVARQSGLYVKKTLLELGGSDPYIVLKDADIDKAAQICIKSRMINNGQSCIAAKRFIVEESVKNLFIEKLLIYIADYKVADPLLEETKLGPMASIRHRDNLIKQVSESIAKGAKCIWGGVIANQEDAYYPATILTHVSHGMPAYHDELFGPVAAVISAIDEDDAIRIANDSVFGLGCAIFSKDIKKAELLASRVEAGNVSINDFVRSDPQLPFGGVKQSGYGRELSCFGIYEFINVKTVVVE
jgi:succinate-semialdehyde dehydrogenase/glutarate-semialdehyde dehydrogenase